VTKIKYVAVCVAIFLVPIAIDSQAPEVTTVYRARVERLVDADTADLVVFVGFRHVLHDRFRLYGIDAWETRGPEREQGLEATRALRKYLAGKSLVIDTQGDKRGKYGRWLVVLWADGKNVNQWLVDQGHAEKMDY